MRGPLVAVWAAVILLTGDAWPQTAAAGLYAEGNDLYRHGEFAKARQRYLATTETGVRDARLFYNLGNACFKEGRIGEAVVWYERALRLDPRDEDTLANLHFVRRIKRDREAVDGSGIGGALYGLYLWPTLGELLVANTICLVALFAAASWRLWRGSAFRVVAAIGFWAVACVGVGAFASLRLYRQATLVEAVVTTSEGTARSGPDIGQTAVFAIHEGTKVVVERREAEWVLVRLDSGLGGWLPVAVVTVI